MNKSYKSLRNNSTGTVVAVGENAMSHGKSAKSSLRMKAASASLALGASIAMLSSGAAMADDSAPAGAQIIAPDQADQQDLATDQGTVLSSGDEVVVENSVAGNGQTPLRGLLGQQNGLLGGSAPIASPMAFGLGGGATVNGRNANDSASIGTGAPVDAIAVGGGSLASGDHAVAIGSLSQAGGDVGTSNQVAIGYRSTTTGLSAVAVGSGAQASGAVASAFGLNANASGDSAVALGRNTIASGASAIALGAFSVADTANTVSLGSSSLTRRVVNMAAGTQSTDAVNVGQLQGVTSLLGAGAAINSDGTVNAPSYMVGGQTKTTVGDAIAALDTNVTNLSNAQSTSSPEAVSYDTSTLASVTLGGSAGTVITNVAAGSISATSTDAVNGSQLFTTNQHVAQNATDIATNKANIATNTADITANTTDIAQNTAGIGTLNAAMADAVKYDTSAQSSITLSGASGTSITNLKAGQVTATSTDAVNGSQLFTTNQNVAQNAADIATNKINIATNTDDITANTTNIAQNTAGIGTLNAAIADAVRYDTSAHSSITLSGTSGTTITNLKAGQLTATSTDAVNGAQIYAMQQTITTQGGAAADSVQYDSSAHDKITFGAVNASVTLTNVKAGDVSASSLDAVNGTQLYTVSQNVAQNTSDIATNKINIATNTADITANTTNIAQNTAGIGTLNAAMADAVKYDASAHASITLSGASGTTITNLKAGQLTATSTDAVNGSQIYAMQQTITTQGGSVADSVQYDSSAHDKITFGAVNAPVTLTNVKAGDVSASSLDAVNGTQLYAVSQNVAQNTSDIANLNNSMTDLNNGVSGIVRQDALTQAISIGANSNGGVISFAGLGGARTLTGVASGAVNASSTEALNGAQLFNASASVASALGGGASVDAKGGVVAPTYTVGGKQVNDVGSAVSNLDGRVTQNTTEIAGIKGDLATVAGVASNAVAYDTADHSKVTLGGADAGTAAVELTNVAAGDLSATSTDAVNGAQLSATNDRVTAAEKAIATLDSSAVAGSTASGQDATAIGGNADASGDHSMASGNNATASGSNSTATGADSTASGDNSTATGASSIASGNNATANGAHSKAAGENSAAFGGNAFASGSNSTAMGANSMASGENSVALGANSVADEANTVSVGSAGNERRITNVAPGVNGTDAVNVNQMAQLRNDVGASLTSLQRSALGGVAAAMAMPNVTPSGPGKTVVAAGVANYKGYGAFGAGVTYRSGDGKWLVNGAVSVTPGGDTGVRAQAGYEF